MRIEERFRVEFFFSRVVECLGRKGRKFSLIGSKIVNSSRNRNIFRIISNRFRIGGEIKGGRLG